MKARILCFEWLTITLGLEMPVQGTCCCWWWWWWWGSCMSTQNPKVLADKAEIKSRVRAGFFYYWGCFVLGLRKWTWDNLVFITFCKWSGFGYVVFIEREQPFSVTLMWIWEMELKPVFQGWQAGGTILQDLCVFQKGQFSVLSWESPLPLSQDHVRCTT